MKSFFSLLSVCALVVTGAVQAGQELTPIPDAHMQPMVIGEPMVIGQPMVMGEPMAFVDPASLGVPLYTNVKYKDLDEMSCCAQPKIISVKDPCPCEDGCGPKCVYIEICVPTEGCELISCRRNGNRIRYDYGKYAVDVRIKKGYIEVDYQD